MLFFISLGMAMFLRTRIIKSLHCIHTEKEIAVYCFERNQIQWMVNDFGLRFIFLSLKINQWVHHARKSVDGQWEEKKKKTHIDLTVFAHIYYTYLLCCVIFLRHYQHQVVGLSIWWKLNTLHNSLVSIIFFAIIPKVTLLLYSLLNVYGYLRDCSLVCTKYFRITRCDANHTCFVYLHFGKGSGFFVFSINDANLARVHNAWRYY